VSESKDGYPLIVTLVILLLFSSAMSWRVLRDLRDRIVVLEGEGVPGGD
jgi:hypothetical protein